MTDYVAAAKNAAPAFGFDDPGIEVLHESENVVCKVTTPDDQFVMRLHRPGYNTRSELDSEVLWVQALEAARIPVPTAVSALNGDYYIPLEINGEITQVGVVEWIAGVPLRELYGQPATNRSLVADYAKNRRAQCERPALQRELGSAPWIRPATVGHRCFSGRDAGMGTLLGRGATHVIAAGLVRASSLFAHRGAVGHGNYEQPLWSHPCRPTPRKRDGQR